MLRLFAALFAFITSASAMTVDEAKTAGLTIVDLSDDWTAYIFRDAANEAGEPLQNRYRAVLLGLANDSGDRDGQPLQPDEHNYLELYGISPTLSVLRARFIEDSTQPDRCADV